MTIREELQARFPKWARYAATRGSRQCAIYLQCVECMGGSLRDAKTCEARECFLWPHGLAAREEKRAAKDGCPSQGENHPASGGDPDRTSQTPPAPASPVDPAENAVGGSR